MTKKLVFIDDSGDPGLKNESSENFVMAAIVIKDAKEAESLMFEMDSYRESLGWNYKHEFKFTKNPKNVVVEMLKRAQKFDFEIYGAYIEKSNFREIVPSMSKFFDKEKLYNWLIKELIREIPLDIAKITIDGRSTKEYQKRTITYLRRETNNGRDKKLYFKFEDSMKTDLLQISDLIAGSINRSLQLDKTDSKKYISILKDKIVKIQKIQFR